MTRESARLPGRLAGCLPSHESPETDGRAPLLRDDGRKGHGAERAEDRARRVPPGRDSDPGAEPGQRDVEERRPESGEALGEAGEGTEHDGTPEGDTDDPAMRANTRAEPSRDADGAHPSARAARSGGKSAAGGAVEPERARSHAQDRQARAWRARAEDDLAGASTVRWLWSAPPPPRPFNPTAASAAGPTIPGAECGGAAARAGVRRAEFTRQGKQAVVGGTRMAGTVLGGIV